MALSEQEPDGEEAEEEEDEEDVLTEEEVLDGLQSPAADNGAAEEDESDTQNMEVEDDREETHMVSDGDQPLEDDASHGRVHMTAGDDTPEEGARRSKRTRYPVLEYWRNERYLFKRQGAGVGEILPTVFGVSDRSETPAPKRKRKHAPPRKALLKSELPDDVKIRNGDKCKVWNEARSKKQSLVVVCRDKTLKKNERELPITGGRHESDSEVVGIASQAFQLNQASESIPGWISGTLELPPTAIKDAEGVGMCSQVFFVVSCQPQSFEAAIAAPDEQPITFEADKAQRFLLSPGDQFFVPPGNVYRLQNHSDQHACKLFWTIIKPVEEDEE